MTTHLVTRITDYCSKMYAFCFCLHRIQKTNINVCISSGLIIFSLVSYGTHDWAKHKSNSDTFRLTASLQAENGSHEMLTSFLCYTNDVKFFHTLRHRPKIFEAKYSETDFVFLTVGSDIENILNRGHIPNQKPCFTMNDTFLYHCCGYSPYLKESGKNLITRETNFVYERHVVTDNYIRIEDFINGKPEMVDLLIKFSLDTSNQTKTDVVCKHRCRGDVPVDNYPEIHIYVDTQNADRNLTKNAFHWYL
ncbi:uncharacterized protein LOC123528969 [Mercenaria mercenaria]|uniref:uncharacterized protein LOC123528969 n=1 Tax=Mercenaria mercenaria TaxID=6596 RepID=UPI001E1E15E4|nr:uncharacterized protein LOC123528969 [Mercenaria mercenaria]